MNTGSINTGKGKKQVSKRGVIVKVITKAIHD